MLIALVTLLNMSSASLLEAPIQTSIFPGDDTVYPGGEGVHDPTIIEFKGKYFCFHTGNGALVRSSSDLKSWKIEGELLPEQPAWLKERYRHRSIWAPDVLILGEKLRVYYCASNWGTNLSAIGLMECEKFDPSNPLAGWKDKGLVLESKPGTDTFNCIDPETRIDAEGRHWLFFGSYFAGIYVVELDPETGFLKNPSKPELIQVARNTGEQGNPLEGAAVCRRGDYYYLFVSYGLAGQGVRSTYRIMVGRSKSITGPYLDREGKSMAEGGHVEVLKTSPPMFSPGHCDVVQLSDGRYVMPYHFYDGRHLWRPGLWGRPALQIRELAWSEDGWPLPGLPVGFEANRRGSKGIEGKWLHQADFGEPIEIELKAGGKIEGGSGGKWSLDGKKLTLTWNRPEAPESPWVDIVQLEYGGGYYAGRNQNGLVVRGIREAKG